MTDPMVSQSSVPRQVTHQTPTLHRDENSESVPGESDLDELTGSDPADAPEIADQLAANLAERLEVSSQAQEAGTD